MPSTRNRYRLLGGALLCLLVVVLLATLYKVDVRGLDAFDQDVGSGPQEWTLSHPAAESFFLFVSAAFGTVAMTVYTAIAAALLVWRKQVRAAVWTVGVMLAAALTTWGLKGLLARNAPGLGRAGHHADQLLVPVGPRHRHRRRRRGRRRAGRPARTAPGPASRAGRRRSRAGAARLPGPDLPRRAQRLRRGRRRLRRPVLGAGRAGGLRPGAAPEGPRGVQHAGADHPAARGGPQPDQGRGRRRLPDDGRHRGGERRVGHPDLVRDDDRGPGPLDGRAGRRRPGPSW